MGKKGWNWGVFTVVYEKYDEGRSFELIIAFYVFFMCERFSSAKLWRTRCLRFYSEILVYEMK